MIIVHSYVVPASQDSRSKVHMRRIVPFSHLVLGPGLRELSFFPLLPLLKDKLLAGPETEVRKAEDGKGRGKGRGGQNSAVSHCLVLIHF